MSVMHFSFARKTKVPLFSEGLSDATLEAELLAILRADAAPQSLDQIVHQLFYRQQCMSDLIVLSRSSMKRKLRLKRRVEALLERGLAEKTWYEGQRRYVQSPHVMSLPIQTGKVAFRLAVAGRDIDEDGRSRQLLIAALALICIVCFTVAAMWLLKSSL